jgi:hypothetical protein
MEIGGVKICQKEQEKEQIELNGMGMDHVTGEQ